MSRKLSLLILAALAVYGALLALVYVWLGQPEDRSAEEQRIYALLRQQGIGFARRVFERQTVSGYEGFDINDKYIAEGLPGLASDTFYDFRLINSQSYSLERLLPATKLDVFLDSDETEPIIDEGRWDQFYKQYPDAAGIARVSRVGFNSTYTQAVVYLEIYQRGGGGFPTNGAGFLLQFRKLLGKWLEQRYLVTSITG